MSRRPPVVVQKFGGSSLEDLDAIRRVAARIVATRRKGCRVVVVVSAMGSTTDKLQEMARAITPNPQRRELDMLLTAGERQTMALLSLAIMAAGEAAQSFTGSQVGIITDRFHSDARIQEIRGTRLLECLRRGAIPIVAGFQGVSYDREITTLGRGGSDVTAVALAAWLKADRCEFYKDVDGLFTENPAVFPLVRPVARISFTELAELAASGAEVIHPRACALAEKYRVPLIIRSSFTRKRGTVVTHPDKLEKAFVRAITHRQQLARVSLVDVRKKRRCLHQVVTRLAAARVPVLFFNHGVVHDTRFDLSFIIPKDHLADARPVIAALAREVGATRTDINADLCSVSVVGPGVGTDAEILSGTLDTLHQAGIHLDAFATSATSLCCFLPEEDLRLAATALLARFRLARR
uniref:Aspartokinase n=1 Tax=candidate division WOR-3 bacterium TaxID=2052148 RepID=A0A7C4CDA1_UNCW3